MTLGELITSAGSDKPEMITAWILTDGFEPEPLIEPVFPEVTWRHCWIDKEVMQPGR